MTVFNEPTKWQTSLVNSGDANVIPQSTPAGTGKASFKDGFPQITQVPIGAGGIAPDRKDFNGLFKVLGDWIYYIQNGGIASYSAIFDYAIGRVVLYNGNLYKCIHANGASSTVVAPDSVSPLGSDYWVQVATIADFANFANIDLSNVTAPVQDFKNMSIAWGMPDYSSGVVLSVSVGQTWTAPENCFISVVCDQTSNVLLKLNNSSGEWITYQVTTSANASSNLIPIEKGTIIYVNNFTAGGVSTKITYYPCKGAN